jgi:hypothetical protein
MFHLVHNCSLSPSNTCKHICILFRIVYRRHCTPTLPNSQARKGPQWSAMRDQILSFSSPDFGLNSERRARSNPICAGRTVKLRVPRSNTLTQSYRPSLLGFLLRYRRRPAPNRRTPHLHLLEERHDLRTADRTVRCVSFGPCYLPGGNCRNAEFLTEFYYFVRLLAEEPPAANVRFWLIADIEVAWERPIASRHVWQAF